MPKNHPEISPFLVAKIDSLLRSVRLSREAEESLPIDAGSIKKSMDASVESIRIRHDFIMEIAKLPKDHPVAIELGCRFHIANIRANEIFPDKISAAFKKMMELDSFQYVRLKLEYWEEYERAFSIINPDGARMILVDMPHYPAKIFDFDRPA